MRTACLLVSLLVGCVSPGGAPQLDTVADHVAIVGHELRIELDGTDPDGDRLSYRFAAPPSLAGIADRASISVAPSGSGVFRWVPVSADLGSHAFDFIVSDGTHDSALTITIDVVASATAPVFRAPLGTGTTLDLAARPCIDLDVIVEDTDTIAVQLAQAEPRIAGASLEHHDPMHATWHWCPTPAQRAEGRHTLVLEADDGATATVKNYVVVLREPPVATCTDDAREPDDNAAQARTTQYPTYASTGDRICANDDDWYEVPLYAGEVMTVDLTFAQSGPNEDLDLHLFRNGVDLMPCDPLHVEQCAIANGQSVDANERMTFTAPATCSAGCTYHVVVRGFDGDAAPYAIGIAID